MLLSVFNLPIVAKKSVKRQQVFATFQQKAQNCWKTPIKLRVCFLQGMFRPFLYLVTFLICNRISQELFLDNQVHIFG